MKKRLLSWFLSLAFLGVAVGYAFIYSGFYDVSATDGHTRVVERILRKTMENSIRYHSRDIAIPSGMDMKDPVLAEKAIGHYSVACAKISAPTLINERVKP